jgi:RNase P/RNase MRP subunit p29
MMVRAMDRRRLAPERRRAARAPLVAAVSHRVGGELQLAQAEDVGENGMKLKRVAGRTYLPRTPVTMAFELPDGGELVRVRGAVVFERAEGNYQSTGVRFEDLSPLDHARIVRFINRTIR